VINVQATLYDGSFHPVDSSEKSFEIAAFNALSSPELKQLVVLLEPIMRLQVKVPDNYFGDIIKDIGTRKGKVILTEQVLHYFRIEALVPLANLFGYTTTLRSLTKGRGVSSMAFWKYQRVISED